MNIEIPQQLICFIASHASTSDGFFSIQHYQIESLKQQLTKCFEKNSKLQLKRDSKRLLVAD